MHTSLDNSARKLKSSWSTQTAWFIDSHGKNKNNGVTPNHPIPWAELRRRLRFNRDQTTSTITILNDLAPDDPLIFDWTIKPNHTITVLGTLTLVRSGSLTSAPTLRNPATNTPNDITDSTVASWATDIGIGRIFIPTSGPAIDSPFWIVKNLGSNKARVTSYFDAMSFQENPAIAKGDTYSVFDLTFVPNWSINPQGGGIVAFQHLDFGDINTTMFFLQGENSTSIIFNYCKLWYTYLHGTHRLFFLNCSFVNCPFISISSAQIFAGLIMETISPGSSTFEIEGGSDVMIESGTICQERVAVINTGYMRIDDFGVFDSSQHGVQVASGSILRTNKLWGSGNALHGLHISGSGRAIAVSFANGAITGTAGDVLLNATTKTWTQIVSAGYLKDVNSDASVISPM